MPIRSSLTSSVVDFGGRGRPIVLLHGLMGRATTWWRVSRWLTSYGHVVGLDARGHGRARRRGSWRTEEFADDVAELISDLDEGPAVIIGHSMGGLHAWVTAARWPELVRAVVVEDMAPDQRGKTVDAWRGYFESWPVPFRSLAQVREFFGGLGDERRRGDDGERGVLVARGGWCRQGGVRPRRRIAAKPSDPGGGTVVERGAKVPPLSS